MLVVSLGCVCVCFEFENRCCLCDDVMMYVVLSSVMVMKMCLFCFVCILFVIDDDCVFVFVLWGDVVMGVCLF